MVPAISPIQPFTVVIIRCFAENSTNVCVGSSFHAVLAPAVGTDVAGAVISFLGDLFGEHETH
jgi:hypothetical protein